jgi:ABC-type transporter Mla MlaB component
MELDICTTQTLARHVMLERAVDAGFLLITRRRARMQHVSRRARLVGELTRRAELQRMAEQVVRAQAHPAGPDLLDFLDHLHERIRLIGQLSQRLLRPMDQPSAVSSDHLRLLRAQGTLDAASLLRHARALADLVPAGVLMLDVANTRLDRAVDLVDIVYALLTIHDAAVEAQTILVNLASVRCRFTPHQVHAAMARHLQAVAAADPGGVAALRAWLGDETPVARVLREAAQPTGQPTVPALASALAPALSEARAMFAAAVMAAALASCGVPTATLVDALAHALGVRVVIDPPRLAGVPAPVTALGEARLARSRGEYAGGAARRIRAHLLRAAVAECPDRELQLRATSRADSAVVQLMAHRLRGAADGSPGPGPLAPVWHRAVARLVQMTQILDLAAIQ